ncbi:Isochorismatase hydrolase [Coniophora puteana RWD-64-598 SS2]|uniref:Isochorismatase hydrolase n=1 Tax=Coniophora puteana (strain RWD-64-598) TaxID=741705 RepID=A0A5M3N7C4_CONPW|nr:Isochorismatase hydrolase [Coniophora puteana RWD-64-598 SS2]EIW86751.1 Isochorismatase hydrolase [Coniophora puteana RWD-64-598 SS2]
MSSGLPVYDTPILGMTARPRVERAVEYGNEASFWVEWPSGLVDLTRSRHLETSGGEDEEALSGAHLEIEVDGGRRIRVDKARTVLVVVDMQNFFLHPDLRAHEPGLKAVDALVPILAPLRRQGVKILWVNWGLTEHELHTIPPSLARGFTKGGRGGFGAPLPGDFGRLLMRGSRNAELYGPLQDAYRAGEAAGADVWVHKNRMSGIWGYQSALDLYLKENGITTLLFGGVNSDQCVLGTLVDAYYRGYDCILVKDITATTSPEGGHENVVYNAGNSYGFATDTERILKVASATT